MKTLNILFWLNVILLAMLAMFYFKIFIKNYLDSHSLLITFLLISSTAISGFFCLDALLTCRSHITKIMLIQNFYGKYESNANFIQELTNGCISEAMIISIIAYSAFLISIICRKIIVTHYKKTLSNSKGSSWDLDSLSKKVNSH